MRQCLECKVVIVSIRKWAKLTKEQKARERAEGRNRAGGAGKCNACYQRDLKSDSIIPFKMSEEEAETLRRMNREWWIAVQKREAAKVDVRQQTRYGSSMGQARQAEEAEAV